MPRATPTLSEFLTPRQGSLTTYVERVENIAGMNIAGMGRSARAFPSRLDEAEVGGCPEPNTGRSLWAAVSNIAGHPVAQREHLGREPVPLVAQQDRDAPASVREGVLVRVRRGGHLVYAAGTVAAPRVRDDACAHVRSVHRTGGLVCTRLLDEAHRAPAHGMCHRMVWDAMGRSMSRDGAQLARHCQDIY